MYIKLFNLSFFLKKYNSEGPGKVNNLDNSLFDSYF